MAVYRSIYISFWTDRKVADEFTPEDKYFYLYLLTNPHTNICGCYEFSVNQAAYETGYNKDTVERLLVRMEKVHNVLRYDKETKEVLILKWFRYNWSKSATLMKGVASVAEHIKSRDFREYVDRVSIGYAYSMETSDTDTDTDTDYISIPNSDDSKPTSNKKEPKKKTAFHPPTLQEVEAYCRERGNSVDAKRFFDYYEVGGWKDKSGEPVRNWKQKLITWEKKQEPSRKGEKSVQTERDYTTAPDGMRLIL